MNTESPIAYLVLVIGTALSAIIAYNKKCTTMRPLWLRIIFLFGTLVATVLLLIGSAGILFQDSNKASALLYGTFLAVVTYVTFCLPGRVE